MTRCEKCEDDYGQCQDCLNRDKELNSNRYCRLARDKNAFILDKDCALVPVNTKQDYCNKCGLTVNY